MPFVTSQSNYEEVARGLLTEGEQLELVRGNMRAVVALTDRRLLVSTFPWTGPGRLIFEAPLNGIREITLTAQKGGAGQTKGCELSAAIGGLTRKASLPSIYHPALSPIVEQLQGRIAQQGGQLGAAPAGRASFVSTVDCARCGASVAVRDPAAPTAACSFCGHHQPVPEAARSALGVDQQLTELLLQARAELTSILYWQGNAAMAYEPLGAFLGMGMALAVALVIGKLIGPGTAICGGLVLAVIFGIAMLIPFHMVDEALSRRRAEAMAQKLFASKKNARCPECGAPVEVPGGVARFDCGHCRAPLVAAEGLIAKWTGDAQAVIDGWRGQALGLADQSSAASRWLGLIVVFGFVLGLAGCMISAAAFFVFSS